MGKKLTREAIKEIQVRIEQGATTRELASEYGVNNSSISRAARGKTWGNEPRQPSTLKRIADALEMQNKLTEELLQWFKQCREEDKAAIADEQKRAEEEWREAIMRGEA